MMIALDYLEPYKGFFNLKGEKDTIGEGFEIGSPFWFVTIYIPPPKKADHRLFLDWAGYPMSNLPPTLQKNLRSASFIPIVIP
jgi:hypothetical protein